MIPKGHPLNERNLIKWAWQYKFRPPFKNPGIPGQNPGLQLSIMSGGRNSLK